MKKLEVIDPIYCKRLCWNIAEVLSLLSPNNCLILSEILFDLE